MQQRPREYSEAVWLFIDLKTSSTGSREFSSGGEDNGYWSICLFCLACIIKITPKNEPTIHTKVNFVSTSLLIKYPNIAVINGAILNMTPIIKIGT